MRNPSLEELETEDFKALQNKKYKQRKKKRGSKRVDSIEEEKADGNELSIQLSDSNGDLSSSSGGGDGGSSALASLRSTSSLRNFFSFKKPMSAEDKLALKGVPVYVGNDIIFV